MTQLILFNVFNGLIVGAFYALMALGLSLILNLSGVINFAHGGFLAHRRLSRLYADALYRLLGRAAARAVPDGAHRPRGRARADPPALRARSALQPAADLRPRLHLRGRHALHLGRAEPALSDSRLADDAAEQRVLSSSPAIACSWCAGRRRGRRRCSSSSTARGSACASAPARSISKPSRCSASTCASCATSISASASISPASRACWRRACSGLQPTIGASLIMPSFVAIIVGGLGSLPGTLLGGLLIGVASGITTVFFPSATEAVIYVMMGAGPAGPAARPARRRRPVADERASDKRGRQRR